jgi:hypothetical protein
LIHCEHLSPALKRWAIFAGRDRNDFEYLSLIETGEPFPVDVLMKSAPARMNLLYP